MREGLEVVAVEGFEVNTAPVKPIIPQSHLQRLSQRQAPLASSRGRWDSLTAGGDTELIAG